MGKFVGWELFLVEALEDVEVVLVALGGDGALLDGLLDGAMGLVDVGAVGEMAVVEEGFHLGEEVGEFFFVEVDHAEFFDAWGVDEEGGLLRLIDVEGVDFGESGGVLAFERPFGDLTFAKLEGGVDGVEEG